MSEFARIVPMEKPLRQWHSGGSNEKKGINYFL